MPYSSTFVLRLVRCLVNKVELWIIGAKYIFESVHVHATPMMLIRCVAKNANAKFGSNAPDSNPKTHVNGMCHI